MCSVDWNAIANWVSALATAITAVFAWMAVVVWKAQLRGTTKHVAAQEIAVAARMLQYAFYDARSPMIWAGEFPGAYYEAGDQRSNAMMAEGYAHVYRTRWLELWPHIAALAKLRPLAGAVLSDAVATATENLARKARELHFLQEQAVKHKRDGDALVARYGDQAFVERVRKSVLATKGAGDPLSVEFETELAALEALLKPHMR